MALAREIKANLEINVVIFFMRGRAIFFFLFFLTILNSLAQDMRNKIIVTAKSPLDVSKISIQIAAMGWHTVAYQIYSAGVDIPQNFPNQLGAFVMRISYEEMLFSSNLFINERIDEPSDFHFHFSIVNERIVCEITSVSHLPLNIVKELKDFPTDSEDLVTQYREMMRE